MGVRKMAACPGRIRQACESRIQETRAAIERLSPIYGEVVRLHKLEGHPLPIVAQMLGVSYGATRARIHRAYKQLANIVGP